MKTKLTIVLLSLLVIGCSSSQEENSMESGLPYTLAENPVNAGKYLVVVSGCNDCHTDAYLMTDGNIPEEDWLAGSPMGWQGPWGTTYASNLRLRVQEWPEEVWVQTLKTRKMSPPMPWMNVNQMSEQDARAIYAYIKSLGPKGEHMPLALAPGEMPSTPYLSMFPQNLPIAESGQ